MVWGSTSWGTRVGAGVVAVASVGGVGASMSLAASTTTVTKYATGTTNVRSAASTSASVAGSLSAGAKVTGVQQSNGWIKIATPANFSGKYVSGSVLSSEAPAPVVVKFPNSGAITGYVASKDHSINVRSGPGLQYPIVGSYAQSTPTSATKVVGTVSGDWVKTSKGYVNKGVLVPAANPFSVNARIPVSQLCKIPMVYNSPNSFAPGYKPSTQRYIECPALLGLVALENAYKAAKGHYAPIDLAYRDAADQQYWWDLWKSGKGHAASPVGTSPHGWGLAVDFLEADGSTEFNYKGTGFAWLTANALKYGFTPNPLDANGEQVDGESYHWNFSG